MTYHAVEWQSALSSAKRKDDVASYAPARDCIPLFGESVAKVVCRHRGCDACSVPRMNDFNEHTTHSTARGARRLPLILFFLAFACGGETETASEQAETPAPEAAEESAPAAEAERETEVQDEGEPELAEAEAESEEAETEAVEQPSVEAPPYASTPRVCEAHPENALDEPPTRRSLSRGEVDFPDVAALNATCEHDPAELAESFNEGGLRRHRQRDYVQSQHYFASALLLDPSQLSARFNLACALARQERIDEAILQLQQLQAGGPDGVDYAARAHRDRDFGAYHGTPILAALMRDTPPVIEAITGQDVQVFSEQEPTTHNDASFAVLGDRVWERGSLSADSFPDFVLAFEPDRRRFRYFNDRPSDEVRAALDAMGLAPMLRNAGWTPRVDQRYLVASVSSRDEDRHTLYVAKVVGLDGMLELIDTRDLPAASCDEGVEVLRTFVESSDQRAFGYVTGCLGAQPLEACLYYNSHTQGAVRRCGPMNVAEEEAGEETDEAETAEP